MTAFVRIERCTNQASADHRVQALQAQGWKACWAPDVAEIRTCDVDANNQPGPVTVSTEPAPFVVVAVLCA